MKSLKSRHIQFIALGGTIGTGLFLGIGEALGNYGPLSILLGYSLTGLAIYCMMLSLVCPLSRDCVVSITNDAILRVKWLLGFHCPAPSLSIAPDMSTLQWVLQSVGISGTQTRSRNAPRFQLLPRSSHTGHQTSIRPHGSPSSSS